MVKVESETSFNLLLNQQTIIFKKWLSQQQLQEIKEKKGKKRNTSLKVYLQKSIPRGYCNCQKMYLGLHFVDHATALVQEEMLLLSLH